MCYDGWHDVPLWASGSWAGAADLMHNGGIALLKAKALVQSPTGPLHSTWLKKQHLSASVNIIRMISFNPPVQRGECLALQTSKLPTASLQTIDDYLPLRKRIDCDERKWISLKVPFSFNIRSMGEWRCPSWNSRELQQKAKPFKSLKQHNTEPSTTDGLRCGHSAFVKSLSFMLVLLQLLTMPV